MLRNRNFRKEPSMRVRRLLVVLAVMAIPAFAFGAAGAASYPDQKEDDFVARDFKLQNGEVLSEVRLHYTTVGTPQRDASGRITNAVLMLHGTTGTGKNFLSPTLGGELFGPGQTLDASKYYLILPD